MKNNKVAADKKDQSRLFLASMVLFIIASTLDNLAIANNISKIFMALSVLLSFSIIALKMKKKSAKNICMLLLLMLITGYLSIILSGSTKIIFMFLFIFSARGIDCEKIAKCDLALKILIIITVLILNSINAIQTHAIYRDGILRGTLGFSHPNFTGHLLLSVCFDILILRKNNHKSNFVICLGFFMLIHFLIDSRAAEIGILIAGVLQLLPINKILNTKKKALVFSIMLLGANIALSLYLAQLPNTAKYNELNNLLSGRVDLFRAFYNHYGINLFGNKFQNYGETGGKSYEFVLDNSYLYLLIHDGILISILFLSLYAKKLNRAISEKNSIIASELIASTFVGLMGRTLFSPMGNPQLFYSVSNIEEEDK